MSLAYYNEIDPYASQWLRNLIARGLIAPGDVDERSIVDVRPDDLRGYDQCHFFAGIGGWSLALRLAGWPDDERVWTGSCPCQPFSAAGKRKGFADDRHLWPEWFRLIRECRPAIVFGEQVARAGVWLDAVCADLEGQGYACGATVLPAAGVGAPHRRERFWFVADASGAELRDESGRRGWPLGADPAEPRNDGTARDVADADFLLGDEGRPSDAPEESGGWNADRSGICPRDVADADVTGLERRDSGVLQERSGGCTARTSSAFAADANKQSSGRSSEPRGERGFWLVEPDVGRVAHGVPARVARLRALGNAIVPQVAAEFIRAAMQ